MAGAAGEHYANTLSWAGIERVQKAGFLFVSTFPLFQTGVAPFLWSWRSVKCPNQAACPALLPGPSSVPISGDSLFQSAPGSLFSAEGCVLKAFFTLLLLPQPGTSTLKSDRVTGGHGRKLRWAQFQIHTCIQCGICRARRLLCSLLLPPAPLAAGRSCSMCK